MNEKEEKEEKEDFVLEGELDELEAEFKELDAEFGLIAGLKMQFRIIFKWIMAPLFIVIY